MFQRTQTGVHDSWQNVVIAIYVADEIMLTERVSLRPPRPDVSLDTRHDAHRAVLTFEGLQAPFKPFRLSARARQDVDVNHSKVAVK